MRETNAEAIVRLPPESNLTDVVLERVRENPQAPAYAVPNGTGGWVDVPLSGFVKAVTGTAKGLIQLGVHPGTMVAVMAATSYQWAVLDQAIWFAGAVSVPIYDTSSPAQVRHILADSGAHTVFVAGQYQESTLQQALNEPLDSTDPNTTVTVLPLTDAELVRLRTLGAVVSDETLEQARSSRTLRDTATLVYTSGTTGIPKGALVTHGNLAESALNILPYAGLIIGGGEQRTVLFMPLAHILARTVQFICLIGHIQIAHSSSDDDAVMDNIMSFHPTWLLIVPRFLEKVAAGALSTARANGQERILTAARNTAVEYSRAIEAEEHGEGPGPGLKLRALHAVYSKLVYPKIQEQLGGQLLFTISGASPLDAELAHFFRGMGIYVQEGYGLTETTAPVTLNVPGKTRLGSVGPPIPGTTIRLDEDDEILVKGVMVCNGYHERPGDDAQSFVNGFFKTGDLGRIDHEGLVYVTGRKKEILVTAGGKNVLPTPLEEEIRAGELVSQVVVVGDNRPFVGALIALDTDALTSWGQRHGLGDLSLAQAVHDERVHQEVQRYVDAANALVSRAESVRKFILLDVEFTEESGYLTPSQKLQRHRVIEEFSSHINQLYTAVGAH